MKKALETLLIICIIIFATACKKDSKEENYVISGNVTGFADGTKFYLKNLSTDVVFDSAVIKNNHFRFEGHLSDTPEEVALDVNLKDEFIYTILLIGNENITINGNISDFPFDLKITGSKFQEDNNYQYNLTKELYKQRNALVQEYFNLPEDKREEEGIVIWEKIGKIDKATDSITINYIKTHNNTYPSIISLGNLKDKIHKDTLQKIFDKYTPEIKKSKYAKIVEVFLKEKIAKIGDKYHNFEGFNQKGEKVKFSNVKGENYTLLDFTSAYCGACISSAGELVEISKKYADTLTIISVSQNPNKKDWLKSLKRDKVTWNSIWDGKGRFSETTIKYGIRGFPTFVLINPQGIIVDKWSGYGKGLLFERLEKKMSKK